MEGAVLETGDLVCLVADDVKKELIDHNKGDHSNPDAQQRYDSSCPGPRKKAVGFTTRQNPHQGKKEEKGDEGKSIGGLILAVRLKGGKKDVGPDNGPNGQDPQQKAEENPRLVPNPLHSDSSLD